MKKALLASAISLALAKTGYATVLHDEGVDGDLSDGIPSANIFDASGLSVGDEVIGTAEGSPGDSFGFSGLAIGSTFSFNFFSPSDPQPWNVYLGGIFSEQISSQNTDPLFSYTIGSGGLIELDSEDGFEPSAYTFTLAEFTEGSDTQVPEPATGALLLAGAAGLAGLRKRKKK